MALGSPNAGKAKAVTDTSGGGLCVDGHMGCFNYLTNWFLMAHFLTSRDLFECLALVRE